MWRLLLGTMGVKSLVQGLNAAATAGFELRTVWSEVRRRNRLATAPPLGPLRGRNSCCLWFWQLVFGVWLRDATSNLPSSPNTTPSQTEVCSTITMRESIHTSKTVVFFTIQRSPRISTSYKFAAPRYRLPCRLYRWATNLTFQRHGKIAQSCRNHKDEVSARLRYHGSNSVVFVHRARWEKA